MHAIAQTAIDRRKGGKPNIRRAARKVTKLPPAQIDAVLSAAGIAIAEGLAKGDAVLIQRFGMFTPPIVRRASTQSNSTRTSLSPGEFDFSKCGFTLSPDFMKVRRHPLRMQKGGSLVHQNPALRQVGLQYLKLSQLARIPKETCRRVLEHVVWEIGQELDNGNQDVAVSIPNLGLFSVSKGKCDFCFDTSQHTQQDSHSLYSDEQSSVALCQQDEQLSSASSVSKWSGNSSISDTSVVSNTHTSTRNENIRAQAPPSLARMRQKLLERGGSAGISELGRTFRIIDSSKDHRLSLEELEQGLARFGVKMNPSEVEEAFEFLDSDNSKHISYNELVVGLSGELPECRLKFIREAFKRLDANCDGIVTVDDLELLYDPCMHPDVQSGRFTKAEALRELLDNFDGVTKDGVVTAREFQDYFKIVSASIQSDEYFELMMRNSWHISGGKGVTANTSNKRELVRQQNGTVKVEEVQDGLFDVKSEYNGRIIAKNKPIVVENRRCGRGGTRLSQQKGETVSNEQRRGQRLAQCGQREVHNTNSPGQQPIANEYRRNRRQEIAHHEKVATKGRQQVVRNEQQQQPTPRDEEFRVHTTHGRKHQPQQQPIRRRRGSYDTELFAGTKREQHKGQGAGDQALPMPPTSQAQAVIMGKGKPTPNDDVKQRAAGKRRVSTDGNPIQSQQQQQQQQQGVQGAKKSDINPLDKLARLIASQRLSEEALLLKLGANRVFGAYSIPTHKFIKKLPEAFPGKFTEEEARCLVNLVDTDSDNEINVDEMCRKMKGSNVIDLVRRELHNQLGMYGIQAAQTAMSRMANGRDQARLSAIELKATLEQICLVTLSSSELQALFSYLDSNNDGFINSEELVYGLRGGHALSKNRESAISHTFRNLDPHRNGYITVQTVKELYRVGKQEDVKSGKFSKPQAFSRLLSSFESAASRGIVSESEFHAYYTNLSPFVDDDTTFHNMVKTDWNNRNSRTDHEDEDLIGRRSRFNQSNNGGDQDLPGTHSNEHSYTNEHSDMRSQAYSRGKSMHAGGGRRGSIDSTVEARDTLKFLRKKLVEWTGADGIQRLARAMKVIDRSHDKKLDAEELKIALAWVGIEVTERIERKLFSLFDGDGDGTISLDEFLLALRGPVNKRRKSFVTLAFQQLDRDKDGVLTVSDIETIYDPSFHPDVRSGRIKKRDALTMFLANFESANDHDGIVTREEFDNYYANVSASIDSDDYFELMMRNAWRLSGGKGQCENTANRRVLVSDSQGNQHVQEVKNDFGVAWGDVSGIREKLQQQGLNAGQHIDLTYVNDKNNSTETKRGRGNILAWEEKPNAEADERVRRDNFKGERTNAASAVQSLARVVKARKEAEFRRRKKNTQTRLGEEQRVEQDKIKNRVKRTVGKSWY